MAYVRLTDPDGKPIWIGPHWVTQLKLPPTGQYHDSAQTLIVLGAREQAVRETVDEVISILEGGPDEPKTS